MSAYSIKQTVYLSSTGWKAGHLTQKKFRQQISRGNFAYETVLTAFFYTPKSFRHGQPSFLCNHCPIPHRSRKKSPSGFLKAKIIQVLTRFFGCYEEIVTKTNSGRTGFVLLTTNTSPWKESREEAQIETWRNWSRDHRRTCLGLTSSKLGKAFPHQSLIKKMSLTIIPNRPVHWDSLFPENSSLCPVDQKVPKVHSQCLSIDMPP